MTSTLPTMRDTILIVDDSSETIAMLADALENAGFTTLVAMRGERAISIARQITPDLVLMDAVMPGMDGFETCRRLKRDESFVRLPVIFMTGLSDSDDVVRGLEAGGVDYVTKPVDPRQLLARIKVHLANARVERSARSALDSSGRHMLAVDEEARLLWWTPQAGRLLAHVLAGGPEIGQSLPDQVQIHMAQASDHDAHPVRVETRSEDGPVGLQIACIGKLGRGEYLLRIIEDHSADTKSHLREKYALSSREAEVLDWIAQGKANRDIADILDMSPRTVNKHLEHIFKKIGVENRTSAAALVLRITTER